MLVCLPYKGKGVLLTRKCWSFLEVLSSGAETTVAILVPIYRFHSRGRIKRDFINVTERWDF